MTLEHESGFRTSSLTLPDRAARGLAWFSIALGAAELLFPNTVGRTVGLRDKRGLLRACGVREIACGIGALQPNPAPAIWSRVGGDIFDLATLSTGLGGDPGQRRNATAAMAAVGAITVLDLIVAAALNQQMARSETARDYSERSGFPNGAAAARGAASRYRTPPDLRREHAAGSAPRPS